MHTYAYRYLYEHKCTCMFLLIIGPQACIFIHAPFMTSSAFVNIQLGFGYGPRKNKRVHSFMYDNKEQRKLNSTYSVNVAYDSSLFILNRKRRNDFYTDSCNVTSKKNLSKR